MAVANGALNLYAKNGHSSWCTRSDYSEAVIQTGGYNDPHPFVFTYGFTEVRVLIPPGKGLWPGVWLYTTSGGCPELDLAEWLDQDTKTVYMSPHYGDCSTSTGSYAGTDWATGWHTIGLDWEPGLLVWYVDGVEKRRVNDTKVPTIPMYALLDITAGGWPGNPDSTTPFPADFQVDYMRVWQKGVSASATPTPTPTPSSSPSPIQSPSPIPTPIPTPTSLSRSDSTPPTISITSPLNGVTISRNSNLTINAIATDNIAVAKVEFYLDGGLKCTDTNTSYSCSTKISGKPGGSHTITAKAYDTSGNTVSASITIKAQ